MRLGSVSCELPSPTLRARPSKQPGSSQQPSCELWWRVGGAPLLGIGFYPRGSRVSPARDQCRAKQPATPPSFRRRWPGPRRHVGRPRRTTAEAVRRRWPRVPARRRAGCQRGWSDGCSGPRRPGCGATLPTALARRPAAARGVHGGRLWCCRGSSRIRLLAGTIQRVWPRCGRSRSGRGHRSRRGSRPHRRLIVR